MSEVSPDVSIVVPTRDRPEALRRCLEALSRQDAAGFEVVVVDDGSADGAAIATLGAHADARIVRGAGHGPATARNLGVHEARGAVILLTDDDCAPDPRWVRRLAAAAATGPAAGRTVNVASGAAPAAAQAITSHLTRRTQSCDGERVGFAPTCNLGAPAALMRRLPFDESYPLAAGEDRDWCARVEQAGEAIRWVPGAVVRHRHEMGVAGFLRQQVRYGRGAARFHASVAAPEPERRRAGPYLGFARAGFAEGPGAGALVCAAQVATGVGFALERARPSGSG